MIKISWRTTTRSLILCAVVVILVPTILLAQISLYQVNQWRMDAGLPPLTGQSNYDVRMLEYECNNGIQGSCKLLQNPDFAFTSPERSLPPEYGYTPPPSYNRFEDPDFPSGWCYGPCNWNYETHTCDCD